MVIATPLSFVGASWFAPIITQMALDTGAFVLPQGTTQVTWLAHNALFERWSILQVAQMIGWQYWPGVLVLPVFIIMYWYYVKEVKRRDAIAQAKIEAK